MRMICVWRSRTWRLAHPSTCSSSLKTETTYSNNKIIYEKKWDTEGNLVYKKGDGLIENFYKGGCLKSKINFVDGKRDGLYVEYFKNGNERCQGEMSADSMDGYWIFFYHNGKKEMEGDFKFGQATNVKIYHDNGELKSD